MIRFMATDFDEPSIEMPPNPQDIRPVEVHA